MVTDACGVEVAQQTNLPSNSPGSFLPWYVEQLKGGLRVRRELHCTVSSDAVMAGANEGARKGLIRGIFLGVVGEILEPAGGGVIGVIEAASTQGGNSATTSMIAGGAAAICNG
jgi:hypothetical protein